MNWISILDEIPPQNHFVLAYNHVYGVGVAWFYVLDEDHREELEEQFRDKYICTCHFIKNKKDGNYCIDEEEDIDIFERSPHFWNLGTVTHWMPLPQKPDHALTYKYP